MKANLAGGAARRVGACGSERGAALAETIVLLAVLIPLMFAIPMIGKLIDLRQTAVQAGRYATWQATVATGAETGSAQVASRFFGSAGASLSTESVEMGVNPLWGHVEDDEEAGSEQASAEPTGSRTYGEFVADWPGHGAVRIDRTTVLSTPWSTGHGDLGIAGTVGGAVRSAGRALGGNRWDLAETSLTRAEVGVDVHTNGWFEEQGIGCGGATGGCVREAGVILVDGWSAGSDAKAEDRVKALVPATHLESVGNLLSNLGVIPILRELRGMDGMFGHVDMRPLPDNANRGMQTYEEPDT